jgi:hypothetical protein
MATRKKAVERPGFKLLRLEKPLADTPLSHEALTAAALLEVSDRAGSARRRGAPNMFMDTHAGPPLPIFQIPVACKGIFDAVAYGSDSATRRVLSTSSNAVCDTVSAEAYDASFQAAKDAAQRELDSLFNTYLACDTGCSKTREAVAFELVNAEVDASYGAFWAWIAYTWTLTVRAKQRFKCV